MIDKIKLNVDIRDAISFFKVEPEVSCPSCDATIQQETMRTGSGRLDAGNLGVDLHRHFIPTKDHGEVFPIIYLVLVCNKCNFAGFKHDFLTLHKNTKTTIRSPIAKSKRKILVDRLFERRPDFEKKRGLREGLASYLLALSSYEHYSPRDSPTIRMAICALRAAWICQEIKAHAESQDNDSELDTLISLFYRKAYFLYDKALILGLDGKEDISNIPMLGPDFDQEYGYDGVIYMHAWLYVNYDMSTDNDLEQRYEMLKKLRFTMSKVFGLGKSSRTKPSALMGVAKTTFDQIQKELSIVENELQKQK